MYASQHLCSAQLMHTSHTKPLPEAVSHLLPQLVCKLCSPPSVLAGLGCMQQSSSTLKGAQLAMRSVNQHVEADFKDHVASLQKAESFACIISKYNSILRVREPWESA